MAAGERGGGEHCTECDWLHTEKWSVERPGEALILISPACYCYRYTAVPVACWVEWEEAKMGLALFIINVISSHCGRG